MRPPLRIPSLTPGSAPFTAAKASVHTAIARCPGPSCAAAGARILMLNPVFNEMEHLEIFASEIAPKL